MKASSVLAIILGLIALSLPACNTHTSGQDQSHEEHQKIVVTSPMAKDIVVTEQYVCQIHSQRHIEVCALQDGYLEEILVKEGQAVKKDEVMFKILPPLYRARLEAERAEANQARIEYEQSQQLASSKPPVVSPIDVALAKAKLDKANAKVQLAETELKFTEVKAPFDGIVDRLLKQLGSLIEKKDVLTTLSDNSVMWVYFNVPEARYLDYMAGTSQDKQNQQMELVLANGNKFQYAGTIGAIEAKFNNETGNIPFRADFPNPYRLLRHGQTGTILIHKTVKNAIVIPQRSTFETLDKLYVYVVGDDHVVRRREITVGHEQDDIFVVTKGLDVNDKIVLEGVRQLKNGDSVKDYEFRKPEEALAHQKNHAE
jgi:membrane fusion protein (multidrug efflux system)